MEPLKGTHGGTSRPETVSTRLQRIAQVSWASPGMVWTTLAHHVDLDWLREAYRRTRKDGAVGVDKETAATYAVDLEANLESLLHRFKKGTYQAPPVRRVHIPKERGKERPIGIPSFEDKVLQRAVSMLLSAVYEQDFLDCSYGFRPRRSAHDALKDLWRGLTIQQGGWVIDLDIESFFDTIDHAALRRVLDTRVRDGAVRRMIGKWLNAGVMEGGRTVYPDTGTPQGGVISPILANILLHEVLDRWFEEDVKPRLDGKGSMVRYADDAVIVVTRRADAERILRVLPKRLARFGLKLNTTKTRLVRFWSPRSSAGRKPETFSFLGFLHHWAYSHRKKKWIIKRRTDRIRLRQAIGLIWRWCRAHRHRPMREQFQILTWKLRGHYNYYGITGNSRSLGIFAFQVRRAWRYWLNRRGGRKRMTCDRFAHLLRVAFPLPLPICVHSALRAAKP